MRYACHVNGALITLALIRFNKFTVSADELELVRDR